MAGRLFANRLRPVMIQSRGLFTEDRIGNREVVGYGYNGEPTYLDRVDFPMPAIRWKENTPDVMVSERLQNSVISRKQYMDLQWSNCCCFRVHRP